jgi:tetratricopeptide (TPR) repeat protein
MGEVYRARDSELERDVAIKVLPEAVSQNPDRLERFRREAKAVAKLAHPNILYIHDYGTEGDTTYSVTELLEGETLRERLEGGALGWRKATEIGAAIADGLGAAHEAGIVHRDLKPSNVFLTADGRVKVLDFGLARHEDVEAGEDETHAPTMTRQTDPGTVLGTVGYMSPEQVRGETVGQRSDIFSLGCVLYEMVAGRQSFKGDTAVETMNAILKEEPDDVSSSGAVLPSELAGTIRRCLEKRPQSRFQSASDLAYNLRTISSASAPTASGPAPRITERKRPVVWIALAVGAVVATVAGVAVWTPWRDTPEPTPEAVPNRIAIAPLENRTGDPSLDTLGVMAADLIAQRFAETAAAEAMVMPAGPQSALTDTRQRGAGLFVSGAYYLDGEALRLQAAISDPTTEELIYAFEPVSGDRNAAAEAIEPLGERIVAAVALRLHSQFDISVMRPPSSYAACQAWQSAMDLWGSDYVGAISHLNRALELDPNFPVPRLDLLTAYFHLGDLHGAQAAFASAQEYLERYTPFERARLRWLKYVFAADRSMQLIEMRHIVELAPQLRSARFDLGIAAFWVNRPAEAVDVLTPLMTSSRQTYTQSAWWGRAILTAAHHELGDYEQQLVLANQGLERFPGNAFLYYFKASALAAMGRPYEVNEVIDDCLRVSTPGIVPGGVIANIAGELRAHGHSVASIETAERAVEWFEAHPPAPGEAPLVPFAVGMHSYALRIAGRWQETRQPLVELGKTGRSPIVVQGALGVIAAHMGDREAAMRIYDELPEHADPEVTWFSTAAARRCYWRACILAHLGEKERAVAQLNEAYAKGLVYCKADGGIMHGSPPHCDIDLEPLWDYPPFQELIRPKG